MFFRNLIQDLARAGFFWQGRADRVQCHHCKIAVWNWRPNMDPSALHRRKSPECTFIGAVVQPITPPPDDRNLVDNRCNICLANPLDCVFLNCGHIYTCYECVSRGQLVNCPVCRKGGPTIKVYISFPNWASFLIIIILHRYVFCITSFVLTHSECFFINRFFFLDSF